MFCAVVHSPNQTEERKLNRPPRQKKDLARIINAYVSLMEQVDRLIYLAADYADYADFKSKKPIYCWLVISWNDVQELVVMKMESITRCSEHQLAP
jgi:hypothetical protein